MEKLKIDIVNEKQTKAFRKNKAIAFIINVVLAVLVYLGLYTRSTDVPGLFERLGFTPLAIGLAILFLVVVTLILIIMVYSKTPRKGYIELSADHSIINTLKKEKEIINPGEIDEIIICTRKVKDSLMDVVDERILHYAPSNFSEAFAIKFIHKRAKHHYTLDLIFAHEKKMFEEIIKHWQSGGVIIKNEH